MGKPRLIGQPGFGSSWRPRGRRLSLLPDQLCQVGRGRRRTALSWATIPRAPERAAACSPAIWSLDAMPKPMAEIS